jgi:hypothetical protein
MDRRSNSPVPPEPSGDAPDLIFGTLAQLAGNTGASRAALRRHDDLGRVVSAVHWPSTVEHQQAIREIAPRLPALTLLGDLHHHYWSTRNGRAMAVPETNVRASPRYELLHAPLGERHIAICALSPHADGTQWVLNLAHTEDRPFSARDLRLLEETCASLAFALPAATAKHDFLTYVPRAAEHTVQLSGNLAAQHPSGYLLGLLAAFYGAVPSSPDGYLLPRSLHDEVNLALHEFTTHNTRAVPFYHAFTKRRLGRVLSIVVATSDMGSLCLSAHEDLSQHPRLRRIKAACSLLPRDRLNIFAACLLIAEGHTSREQIARRAGFASLKRSSAHRLINHARRIVESA